MSDSRIPDLVTTYTFLNQISVILWLLSVVIDLFQGTYIAKLIKTDNPIDNE